MLKYTIAAFHKIVADLKLIAHVATIVMQSFMTVYLVCAIIVNTGSRIINSVLLLLTVLNFIIYLVTYGKSDKLSKKAKGITSKTYKILKLSLNAISLASVIYSIYASSASINGITLVTTPIMVVLWVTQVAFELIKVYVSNRATLFINGLQMDFEFAIKPITKARNFLHDFLGEEREDEVTVPEENRRILTKQAELDDLERGKKPKGLLVRAFDELKRRVGESFSRFGFGKGRSKSGEREEQNERELLEENEEREKITSGDR